MRLALLIVPLLACAPAGPPPDDVGAGEVRGAPIDSAPLGGSPDASSPEELEPESAAAVDGDSSANPPVTLPGHNPVLHGAAAQVADAPDETPRVVGDTTFLSFSHLVFGEFDPVEAELTGEEGELPEEIRALDGRRVSLLGFMVPMEFEEDSVRTFILMRFPPGCCFGLIPSMDQWIDVEMVNEEGAKHAQAQIVRVTGTFEVGAVYDDYDYISSVYRMRAGNVELDPKE